MSNLIATDLQNQEVDSALIELFEIDMPNGSTLYFHPGLNDDLTDLQFKNINAPGIVAAGSLIVGAQYTIIAAGTTIFTNVGASSNSAGTAFTATGVGAGTGTATQTTYTVNTYEPMPMMIDGLDMQADGAISRPALTIANVGTLLRNHLGTYKNDDLIGQRVRRRRTLAKYLIGGTADTGTNVASIEFPRQEYIIDRIAAESGVAITYEVAMPFDLEGIKLPRRVVVGKYCSWQYQGYEKGEGGGCTWTQDGAVNFQATNGTDYTHNGYFNVDDSPLILAAPSTTTAWSSATAYTEISYATHSGKTWLCLIPHTNQTPAITSSYWIEAFIWTEHANSTAYAVDALVRYGDVGKKTIWKCLRAHTSSTSIVPISKSPYWVREDLCGKTLNSCKCRYGFVPSATTASNLAPSGHKNAAARLPFGSFPGTLKF